MQDDRTRVLKSTTELQPADIRSLYDGFDSAIAELDCGKKCAPHNPSGQPFCCDICVVVPAAYKSEWKYLEANTDLWHKWRADECEDTVHIKADTPKGMLLSVHRSVSVISAR